MGIKIYGIVNDGGGGNEKFFRSIVEKLTSVQDWSSNQNISFSNPIDISRRIHVWSCGTHSLKAVKNNLYRSQPNNVYFGWKDIERIYLREEKRLDSNVGRRTDLTKHCVCLEKYTLTNVTYAKSPFTEKSICEAIQYLCLHLNVAFDEAQSFESDWDKYSFYCNILERVVTSNTNNILCSNLALLKYQVAVQGLFVERLLCARWKLNM